jgi:hypothetical protein
MTRKVKAALGKHGGLADKAADFAPTVLDAGSAAEQPDFVAQVTDPASATYAGDSYSPTLPASGGQMNVRYDSGISETLTDSASTNGEFNPGDSATWSLSPTFTETIEGGFTYGGVTYPVFYDNDSQTYIAIGLDKTVTGTFTVESVAPCYVPGTAIQTARGPALIEDLRIGDHVMTAGGASRPVKWIGRRSYAAAFARRNPGVWPVQVKAGAIADGLPRRDLFISPNHALFIDGVLVEAGLLTNGSTILSVEPRDEVTYFNIEFETHDIVLAEGLPAESFLDRDCRNMFANAAEYHALYPDEAPVADPVFFARRVEDGPDLARIRARIAARAGHGETRGGTWGALAGRIEHLDRAGISGWAYDAEQPDEPVVLEILADGVTLARVMANRQRADLRGLGGSAGRCAFDLRFPAALAARQRQVITVRRAADAALLPGGQLVLEAQSPATAVMAHIAGQSATENRALGAMLDGIDALLSARAASSGETAARRGRFWAESDGAVAA